ADVVATLRTYLLGKAPDAPVWPRPALKEIVVALRHDLEEAAIPYVVDGSEGPLFFDFHGLRHSYVLMLDQSGATLKEAMQLARHSDPKLTMARYGRLQLHDLGAAVERLPSLLSSPQEKPAVIEATGTSGDPAADTPALTPKLTPSSDLRIERLTSLDPQPARTGHGAFCPNPLQKESLRLFDTTCNPTREAPAHTKDRGRPLSQP